MNKVIVKNPDAPLAEATPVLSLLERVMSDPALPIERIEQAFAFYQKVEADAAKKAWTRAFVAAESGMEQIKATASNPQTHSKYATFDALDAAMRPIYSKHGFAFSHTVRESEKPDYIVVVTHLIHEDGFEREYQIPMPCDGKGAKGADMQTKTHAVASANTYGRRYNVGNAFNIAIYRDDDGNAAGSAPVNSRAVVEQMPSDESASKRDEIMKALNTYKTPLSPEDQGEFAERYAAGINSLRRDDAQAIRQAYASKKAKQ